MKAPIEERINIKMKKIMFLLSALCMLISTVSGSPAAAADGSGVFPALAGENGTTYVNLFEVIVTDEWDPVWTDYISAVVGETDAPAVTDHLQSSVTSDLYGPEAADAFADASPRFDCWFINDAAGFTFKDDTVTVLKTDGTSETHTYEYLGQYNIGENETMNYMGQEISMAFPCDVYKSTDEAGEFNYFFLRDDTMETTWHTEFRYGKDLEELQGYLTGPYGYWLAAGIDADADEETIRKVIALFCLENMDYSAHSGQALAQLSDLGLIGTWQADTAALGEAYADVDLSMTIDEAGHGITTMNGEQTSDFEAYAVDNGEKNDGMGLYVAFDNLEGEAEAAPYTLTVNGDGQTVLTLSADDGTISWVKQDKEEASGIVEISTAEELAAVNNDLSGHYVLTADIDLGGTEWTPLGTWVPSGESEEEQEIPSPEHAFTGTFDGQGHTISNLVIDQPEGWALGLFGCISGAQVGNFTLENASVDGSVMTADVVGYSFMSTVSDVTLKGGKVSAHTGEMSSEGMYGGIVGAGMGSLITDCAAEAEIILPDNTANAGIVGGGLEMTSVVNCTASGSIAAGDNCYGLGGVSGCAFGAEKLANNTADTVSITAGDNCYWIGGITGYAGGFAMEEAGIPVTAVTGCAVKDVTIVTGDNADGIAAIVGSGFYSEAAAAAMGAPFDQPTVFEISECAAENMTVNGETIE